MPKAYTEQDKNGGKTEKEFWQSRNEESGDVP
jgi:hypothetical protein